MPANVMPTLDSTGTRLVLALGLYALLGLFFLIIVVAGFALAVDLSQFRYAVF